MISLSAPPISSIIRASSAGKPAAASWRASIATFRLEEAPIALTSLVASTTWLLMEEMAEVKVVPAAALSASEESGPREAAVESGGGGG